MIGCSSHASYPFEGVSAQAIAAGILARLEGNASPGGSRRQRHLAAADLPRGEGLRDGYEVTTPERF